MTTIHLGPNKSVTITPKHGQVELHMVKSFIALSERLPPGEARNLGKALIAAADQLLHPTTPLEG